jgi:subtilisin family serine protease
MKSNRFCVLSLILQLAPGSIATAAEGPTVKTAERFAVRAWVSGERRVFVAPANDSLVVRTRAKATAEEVALLVERAGLEIEVPGQSALPRVGESAKILRRFDLFQVRLLEPVRLDVLARLAEAVAAAPGVLQAYPTLTRGNGRAFADDHLIVTARPGQLDRLLEAVLPELDGRLVRRSLVPDTALVAVGRRMAYDAIEASRFLRSSFKSALLLGAEPDLYRELALQAAANDPLAVEQWHLYRSITDTVPGTGQIFADLAWDQTLGDPQVVVAVVDTGIDIDHEDLVDKIVGGFDAVDGDNDPRPECSWSQDGRAEAPDCPASAPYRESHGTAVSGLVAAHGNNGLGVSGVCPLCSIMPVRFIGDTANSSLTTAETFTRAVNEGAWVINNSWGSGISRYFPLSQSELTALRHARTQGRGGKGTVITFAAGNDTADVAADAYARQGDVIAVAATTNLDDWAYYSNYGREIDVAAPAVGGAVPEDSYGIVTTDYTGDDGYDAANYTNTFGGTSAASPIVAGLAGLLLSRNPELTADQVRLLLTSTADKIVADKVDWPTVAGEDIKTLWAYDANGHSLGFGWGRVNAAAATTAASAPTLQGALCTAAGCGHCDADGRCQTECATQASCPGGSFCEAGLCVSQRAHPTDIGEPCVDECTYCLPAFDSDLAPMSICTDVCTVDDDCPSGFNCRLLDASGTRICSVGSATAGQPSTGRNCRDAVAGGQTLVLGEDGQPYCTDICTGDEVGACPYGFHCGEADCQCTRERSGYCAEYTCSQVPTAILATWPFEICFADPGFGVTCAGEVDCKTGDYCDPNGLCHVDDRTSCLACVACTAPTGFAPATSEECGPRSQCIDLGDGTGGHCIIACHANTDCPGDSICGQVPFHNRTIFGCVSIMPGANGELCDPNYVCKVNCRGDVPCPDGLVCSDAGACVTPPPPPEKKQGCTCGTTGGELSGWLAIGVLVLTRRRRARG